MKNKLLTIICGFLFVLTITACASTSINEDAATITKHEDALFWKIDGKDSNGNPSKLYVLGTIHLGDDRLYPIPKYIEDAFNNSNRIVSELSKKSWENSTSEIENLQNQSQIKENLRTKKTGKTFTDYLTEDELLTLTILFGNPDTLKAFETFEPWVSISLVSGISNLYLKLLPEKSYDVYFINKALESGRNIEGLDSLKNQLDIMQYGDWDFQLDYLKNMLDEISSNPTGLMDELSDLYNAYLAHDPDLINKALTKASDKKIEKDFNDKIFLERNKVWAEEFDDYLKRGGTTFIFAGCGHFAGKNSVFNFMKKNGTLNF